MKRVHIVAAVAMGSVVLCASCVPLDSLPSQQDSVRNGTFNTQFLPGSGDDTTRSARIAARILACSYDIVVLNEVLGEETREVFVQRVLCRECQQHVAVFAGRWAPIVRGRFHWLPGSTPSSRRGHQRASMFLAVTLSGPS